MAVAFTPSASSVEPGGFLNACGIEGPRQPERERGGAGSGECESSALRVGERLCESEADPVPVAGGGSAGEDVGAVVGEAAALVADVDGEQAAVGAHGDGDGTGAVAVRVVEQYVEDLGDHGRGDAGDGVVGASEEPERPGIGGERAVPAFLELVEGYCEIGVGAGARSV